MVVTILLSATTVFVCLLCCAVGLAMGNEMRNQTTVKHLVVDELEDDDEEMIDLSKVDSITNIKRLRKIHVQLTYAYGQAYRKYDAVALTEGDTEEILKVIAVLGREIDRVETRIYELEN